MARFKTLENFHNSPITGYGCQLIYLKIEYYVCNISVDRKRNFCSGNLFRTSFIFFKELGCREGVRWYNQIQKSLL